MSIGLVNISETYRSKSIAFIIVFESVIGMVAWLVAILAAANGFIPYWLAFILNTIIAYLLYIPMHEAAHKNISGTKYGYSWIDDVVGHVCSLPLRFSFSAHRLNHLKHHAFTNDKHKDPDYYVAGSLFLLPIKVVMSSIVLPLYFVETLFNGKVSIVGSKVRKVLERNGGKETLKTEKRFFFLNVMILLMFTAAGHLSLFLCVWYLPSKIAILFLNILFAWLPHYPHEETDKYLNTKVFLFPGSSILLVGINYHLVHHLYPRVPYYKLASVYQEIKIDLTEQENLLGAQ